MQLNSTAACPASGTGKAAINAERIRQIKQEGWTAEHDDGHRKGELAQAAFAYVTFAVAKTDRRECESPPCFWPLGADWWKPTSPFRCLVKAGALYLAESDRQARAGKPCRAEYYKSRAVGIAGQIDKLITTKQITPEDA